MGFTLGFPDGENTKFDRAADLINFAKERSVEWSNLEPTGVFPATLEIIRAQERRWNDFTRLIYKFPPVHSSVIGKWAGVISEIALHLKLYNLQSENFRNLSTAIRDQISRNITDIDGESERVFSLNNESYYYLFDKLLDLPRDLASDDSEVSIMLKTVQEQVVNMRSEIFALEEMCRNSVETSRGAMVSLNNDNQLARSNLLQQFETSRLEVAEKSKLIDEDLTEALARIDKVAGEYEKSTRDKLQSVSDAVEEAFDFKKVVDVWKGEKLKYSIRYCLLFLCSISIMIAYVLILPRHIVSVMGWANSILSKNGDEFDKNFHLVLMLMRILSESIFVIWFVRLALRIGIGDFYRANDAGHRVAIHHTFVNLIRTRLADRTDRAAMLSYLLAPLKDGSGDDSMPAFTPLIGVAGEVTNLGQTKSSTGG